MLLAVPKSVNLLEGIPPPSAQACVTFIDVANQAKIASEKPANMKEKAILKERAKEMVEVLRNTKFSQQRFKVNCQYTPPIVTEVADAIGQKYGRLSMRAKTKFHAE